MEDLRKCPFCGGPAVVRRDWYNGFYCECTECKSKASFERLKQDAILRWNGALIPEDERVGARKAQVERELEDRLRKDYESACNAIRRLLSIGYGDSCRLCVHCNDPDAGCTHANTGDEWCRLHCKWNGRC